MAQFSGRSQRIMTGQVWKDDCGRECDILVEKHMVTWSQEQIQYSNAFFLAHLLKVPETPKQYTIKLFPVGETVHEAGACWGHFRVKPKEEV